MCGQLALQDPGLAGDKKNAPPAAHEPGNGGGFAEWPARQEWLDFATMIGLAPWRAEDEWLKQEAAAPKWRGIGDWQAHAKRVLSWWVRDGRPMEPKNQKAGEPGGGLSIPAQIARKDQMLALQKFIDESPCNQGEGSMEDRHKLRKAQKRLTELREQVAFERDGGGK